MADTEKTVVSFTAYGISGKSYFVGEKSSVQVYGITVTYNDGSTERITTGFTVTQVDTSKAGVQYSTVAYSGIEIEIEIHIFDSYTGEVGSPVKTDVTAYLDLDTGTLNVSGTGALSSTFVDSDGNYPPSSFYTRTKKIIFSEGITEISNRFANDFSNIEDVIFPDSLTKIGDQNFSTILASAIEIPESVTEIGNMVFNMCPNLTELVFHEGLESIGSASFMSCPLLKSVVLPESLKIMRYSFSNCALENMVVGGEGAVLDGGNLSIPACENIIIRAGTIAAGLKYTNIKSLTLGGKVKFSGDSNFYGNNYLTSVVISDGITQIPSYCFTGCTSLSTIEISSSVETIGTNAFAGTNSPAIKINQEEDAISGAPWGATNATIEWLDKNKQITGIKVSSLPDKVEYKKGEVFNSSGLTVKAVYNNDTEEEVTDYILSSPDMSTSGIQTITVSYGDYTTTFSITVHGIISIKAKEYFGKNSNFFIGDTNTGNDRYAAKSLTATYENGDEETISYGNFTETAVDTSKAGSYYTTISYEGVETQNPYTVYGSPFTTRTGYPNINYSNLIFDLDTGLCTISGTNQLGSPEIRPYSLFTRMKTLEIGEGMAGIAHFFYCQNLSLLSIPSTFETLTESMMQQVLGYGGIYTGIIRINAKKDSISDSPWGQTKATILWTAKPQSLNIKTLPDKLKYTVGDTFDPTGIECKVQYSNGKEYNLDGELSYSVNMSESGKQTVTVSCTEEDTVLTAKFQIEIEAPEKVKGIRISKYPDKTYYKIGDSLDTSGMEVMKVTESGKETAVTNYQTSGFNSSKAGTNTVRVIYTEVISDTESETFSTTFQVQITNDGQNPFEENSDSINITVHWINGEFEDLTNENIQQSSVILQESICSENYFIFGGCVCNQISFSVHHKQFDGTGEEFYPSGKIEVYIEKKGTKIKIFTGEIDSAERVSNSLTRNFVAYDYLYKLRNTDIAWWYKNRTVDSQMVFTQKQFRDALFAYLGIEQVETTLEYDNASVPNTNVSNEMNVINIIKDLCLQNSVFGWMNRDGKFEYLKLPENSYQFGTTVSGVKIYKYFEAQIHLDTFKSFYAKEGRIWFPQEFMADPYPGIFSSGEPSAQEAYEKNIYHNRNSFFVGNQDWLNMAFDADEYGVYTRSKPLVNLCYGTTSKLDPSHLYRAQEYTTEVVGNPFNMVGQTVEMKTIKYLDDGTELPVLVNSYIMSRTLKISGGTSLIDTYSAKNSPYNGNNQQLGKYTPEISATVNQTRSELPTISYEEFSDGTDIAMTVDDGTTVKKAQLRCIKRIKKADYDALVASGNDRKDTLYFTYEEV